MKQQTNLKELITQAGFKSQVEFAEYYEVREETIIRWCKEPPRRVVQYLNLIIECHRLEKDKEALERLLSGYLHPES